MEEKQLEERCPHCGAKLKQTPYSNKPGGEVTCPNHYREGEKYEDCQEVIRETPENKQ